MGLLLSGSALRSVGQAVRLESSNQRKLTDWFSINICASDVVQRLKGRLLKSERTCDAVSKSHVDTCCGRIPTWLGFVDGGIGICLCSFRHMELSLFRRSLLQRFLSLVLFFGSPGIVGLAEREVGL